MRLLRPGRLLLLIWVGIALAAGCSTAPAPDGPVTYQLAPRTARPSEQALPPTSRQDGETTFEIIGLTTGITTVLGSHAELPATGRFELDLYYDVPPDAVPTGLRVFGGPTLADFSDLTGVDIPLG